MNILSQDLSQAVQNRLPLGLKGLNTGQDLLKGFFYRDHARNS
jgi:hypothetical protein